MKIINHELLKFLFEVFIVVLVSVSVIALLIASVNVFTTNYIKEKQVQAVPDMNCIAHEGYMFCVSKEKSNRNTD